MFNKKIMTTVLALLCVSTMAIAALAPIATTPAEGVQVACDLPPLCEVF